MALWVFSMFSSRCRWGNKSRSINNHISTLFREGFKNISTRVIKIWSMWKTTFNWLKNRSSGLSNPRQFFTAFRYVASIRLPSCLCSADLSVSIVLHCYCYRSEVMYFEAVEVRLMSKDIHFKALWALSITGDAQTCVFLKICSLRLPALWRNSWFSTEGWRRRPAMSRGHVCLMALVKVNQAHARAVTYERRRQERDAQPSN